MGTPIVVALVIFASVGIVALRHVAARRVAAGHASSVWLLFPTQVVGILAAAYAGCLLLPSAPVVGIVVLGADLVLAALFVRLVRRLRASIGRTNALELQVDALSEFALPMVGLMLVGGLITVVGLIVWGLLAH